MSGAERLSAPGLELQGVAHGFFTRRGGVSDGLYTSLNGGVGSRDAPARVEENRARMALALGISSDRLMIPYQVHSSEAQIIGAPWRCDQRPRCDGLVTATRGLGLGVTGADCGMALFADPQAGVIGAAHAGWKGALFGVIEATVAAMTSLGARPSGICAALGPCIAQASYEVGPEFIANFLSRDAASQLCFVLSEKAGHWRFDLHAYLALRARRAGVENFHDLGLDTYADEARFYSYRRATHRGEADYGRLVAAIALV